MPEKHCVKENQNSIGGAKGDGNIRLLIVMEAIQPGGTESALLNLLNELKAYQEQVRVTVRVIERGGAWEARIPGNIRIEYVRFGSPIWKYAYCYPKGRKEKLFHNFSQVFRGIYVKLHGYAGLYRKVLRSIKREESDSDWDAVIDFVGYGSLGTAYTAEIFPGIRKATWIHSDLSREKWIHKVIPWLEQFDRIFCVSETTRQNALKEIPQFTGKMDVLYNQMDIQKVMSGLKEHVQAAEDMKHPCIVTVGRLQTPPKKTDIAIEAAYRLVQRGLDFHWYWVGEGPDREMLENMIKEYSLSEDERFVLLGQQANPYAFMREADFYVQPSAYEGLPIAIDEAQLIGCKILATDIPSIREAVDFGPNPESSSTRAALFQLDPDFIADSLEAVLAGEIRWEEGTKEKCAEHLGLRNKKSLEEFLNFIGIVSDGAVALLD